MFRSSKFFVIVLIVLVFATSAFAFAASNTVPASYAGDGVSTTSGYTVTNVLYNLNTTTPSTIDSVTFDLNASAATVKIQLVASGAYYNCSGAGSTWTCTTAGATVSAANQLRVIASQ